MPRSCNYSCTGCVSTYARMHHTHSLSYLYRWRVCRAALKMPDGPDGKLLYEDPKQGLIELTAGTLFIVGAVPPVPLEDPTLARRLGNYFAPVATVPPGPDAIEQVGRLNSTCLKG